MLELGAAGSRRAADRAHRRRQDAGRVPAEPGRAARGGLDRRLHTLYVSPLKALTTDIARNLTRPVEEMGLPVRIETRTGDTPQNRRKRQRTHPPDLLLTTPESLALLLSYENAADYFGEPALRRARRAACAGREQARRAVQPGPGAPAAGWHRRPASSACRRPWRCRRGCSAICRRGRTRSTIVQGDAGAEPEVGLLLPEGEMPWAGHMAIYAARDVYRLIRERRVTLVFVNTRAQAELMFGALWRLNKDEPADRAAPWQPRGRAAAQGRGRDGGGCAARRGLHLLARSRHRLGRHRPRRPGGRTQGCGPAAAADRPRQPSPRRAEPRRCWCRPTGSRCWNASPPRTRWPSTRSTAAPCSRAASTCWRSTSPASPAAGPFDADALYRRGPRRRRRSPSSPRADFDAVLELRRHRRLRAGHLRALPPARAAARTGCGG